jgi:hypothetical protein
MLKRIAAAATLGLLALTMMASAALADDWVCRGTIGKVKIDGNVIVPAGATCKLNGTRVDGNVEVRGNARLYASGVRVDGNVQSQGFRVVHVTQRSYVDGDIQLENGRSGGNARILASTIDGNLQVKQNRARLVIRGDVVRGDLQAFQNRGGVVIQNNRIAENLQCKQNNPAPTGGNNRAGDKEGQCARL